MTPRRFALRVLMALLLAAGAAAGPASALEPRAYVREAVLWPTTEIPVCWEQLGDIALEEREITRVAVADTWERNSAVRFVGWDTCTLTSRGIRIYWSWGTPRVEAFGADLDGLPNGMYLNANWDGCGRWWRDACMANVAVHEFGHALGFVHEHERRETPGWCHDLIPDPDGMLALGSWDLHSVMNYCNPTWINGGELSALDKAAVRTLYGPPVPACSDGVDNDVDGRSDFPDDAGCRSAADDHEGGTPEVLVAGRKLKITQRFGVQKFTFGAADPAILPPEPNSPNDPVLRGAELVFSNPETGDLGRVRLPKTGWERRRNGALRFPGRCAASVKRGKWSARCKRIYPVLRLDEAAQEQVTVRLEFGGGGALCTSFGGEVRRDEGTGTNARERGRFFAKRAPAPDRCDL